MQQGDYVEFAAKLLVAIQRLYGSAPVGDNRYNKAHAALANAPPSLHCRKAADTNGNARETNIQDTLHKTAKVATPAPAAPITAKQAPCQASSAGAKYIVGISRSYPEQFHIAQLDSL